MWWTDDYDYHHICFTLTGFSLSTSVNIINDDLSTPPVLNLDEFLLTPGTPNLQMNCNEE